MLNELKVFDDDDNMNTNTYEKVKEFSRVDIDEDITVKKQMTPELKIDEHIEKCKDWKIDVDDNQKHLPFMYWVPKMHKNTKQTKVHRCICMLFNKTTICSNNQMLESDRPLSRIRSKKTLHVLRN